MSNTPSVSPATREATAATDAAAENRFFTATLRLWPELRAVPAENGYAAFWYRLGDITPNAFDELVADRIAILSGVAGFNYVEANKFMENITPNAFSVAFERTAGAQTTADQLREILDRQDAEFSRAEPNHIYEGAIVGFALDRQYLIQDNDAAGEGHFVLHDASAFSDEQSRQWSSHEPGEQWIARAEDHRVIVYNGVHASIELERAQERVVER